MMIVHERAPLLSSLRSDSLVRRRLGNDERENCLAASAKGERLPQQKFGSGGYLTQTELERG